MLVADLVSQATVVARYNVTTSAGSSIPEEGNTFNFRNVMFVLECKEDAEQQE
jgi:hypothetical protein